MHTHTDWNCNVAYEFRLSGAWSIQRLQTSLDEVIRRHGSLRTRVITVEGVARQQVDAPRTACLESLPVAGASTEQIEANARRLCEEFYALSLDPAVGPLFDVRLLKLADHEHWLVLRMHRLIADCSSMDQVARELWLQYAQLLQSRSLPDQTNPTQYSDYVLWQQRTDRDWSQRHASYWKQRLAGATHLRWPADARVAEIARGALGRMNRQFENDLSAELRNFARDARTLAANVMLAIYVAVLWRRCAQKDFILPCKIAGRHAEHKSVVGYFTQILYLRIELDGGETFSELLSRLSKEFFRALAHQDFGRVATRNPDLLAGTFFQWITWNADHGLKQAVPAAPDPAQLSVERIALADFGENHTAVPPGLVAVEVTFFDTAQGIYASGVYRADLFAPNTMESFMEELHSATKELIRTPHSKLPPAATRDESAGRSDRLFETASFPVSGP
jgi:hypothetical protein